MKTIIFDESCTGWSINDDLNRMFLEVQKAHIIDKFLYRGYIYLNEIYDILGARWNPHDENTVWINKGCGFKFKIEQIDENVFTVNIG